MFCLFVICLFFFLNKIIKHIEKLTICHATREPTNPLLAKKDLVQHFILSQNCYPEIVRIVTVLCLSLRKHFKGATCSISSSECTDWIECYLLGLSRVECYLPGLPTCTRSSVTLKDSCLFLYFIARDFLAPRQTVASRKIRSVTLHVLSKRNREFARKTYSGSTGCVRFFLHPV